MICIMGVCLVTSGCNAEKGKLNITTEPTPQEIIKEMPMVEPIKEEPVQKEPIQEEPLEITESNKESINALLSKRRDVYEVKWAYDGKFVAFVKGNTQMMEGQLFLWKVGDKKPIIIEDQNDRICEIIWSPDSNYAFIDIGTSSLRAGCIVAAKECRTVKCFTYTGGSYWSPDSKWIAIGVESTIEPITPTELNGVTDLAILNIKTYEKKIIAKAAREYYFIPRSWDKDGILHYEKYYYEGKESGEKLTFVYKQDG